MDYLPKDATIEEACNWLQAKTGQTWVLPRLLECHLTPHFWLDYKPGYPTIYGDRIEGYQTRMIFQGDLCRLESDRGDALVNMFTAHDGTLVKVQPALRVPLGGRSKPATPGQRTPHRNARAENNPPLKVISKWQANPDAVEVHERTQGAHVLALEGR